MLAHPSGLAIGVALASFHPMPFARRRRIITNLAPVLAAMGTDNSDADSMFVRGDKIFIDDVEYVIGG